MLFTDIVSSSKPLESLVKLALTTKGITVTQGTLDRYTSLLEAALIADEGGSLDGSPWADFVGGIEGDRFEGCCSAIGHTLGASASEIAQFLAIANATGDVLVGKDVALVEAELFAELETIVPTEPEAYSHLDDRSKEAAIAADVGRDLYQRSEPSHRAADEEVEAGYDE